MNFIGNIIWLIFGGLAAALGYIFGGFVLCVTIVGIPFGLQCFKLAGLVLWPFGKRVVPSNSGMGCLSLFANIIWLIFGGLYTALVHLVFAALLFITIIGIPFARQHLKLMELSLSPFGKAVICLLFFAATISLHAQTANTYHLTKTFHIPSGGGYVAMNAMPSVSTIPSPPFIHPMATAP